MHELYASFLLPRQNPNFGKIEAKDALESDGLVDAFDKVAMGNCAEVCAEKYDISRESLDAHAIESYKRAERAWKEGAFDAEIAPIVIKGKKGDTVVKEDEEYKKVMFEKIPTLKSAFKQGGRITAANSSNINDGASALILMSAEKAKELGVKPLAKIICEPSMLTTFTLRPTNLYTAYADAGVEPTYFPAAPTVALPIALERAGLEPDDIAAWEVNEAFSVVVRIVEKVLGVDPAKVNVHGYVESFLLLSLLNRKTYVFV